MTKKFRTFYKKEIETIKTLLGYVKDRSNFLCILFAGILIKDGNHVSIWKSLGLDKRVLEKLADRVVDIVATEPDYSISCCNLKNKKMTRNFLGKLLAISLVFFNKVSYGYEDINEVFYPSHKPFSFCGMPILVTIPMYVS